MTKRKLVRLLILAAALGLTLFLCHVSIRLVEASKNYVVFKTGEEQVPFLRLVLFAAYLYFPDSYNHCTNNLRQIDGAKEQWALEKNKRADDKVSWGDIAPYIKAGKPFCPHGGMYRIGRLGDNPTCTVPGHSLP